MDWKNVLIINRKNLVIRISAIVISFLLFYWGSHILEPYSVPPLSEVYYLGKAFSMLLYCYIPIELGIVLVRLYLLIEFKPKTHIAISYLIFFLGLSIFLGFGNKENEVYVFIGGFIFLVLLVGLVLSFWRR